MPGMYKKLALVALLVFIGTTKIGIIQGAAEPPPIKPEYQSALLADAIIPASAYIEVTATAYASVPEETSDHPFITASGVHVHQGTLAANWLPFGTKVKIPQLFGNQIFTVEDHMNHIYDNGRIDIWMPSVERAIDFGIRKVNIEVL